MCYSWKESEKKSWSENKFQLSFLLLLLLILYPFFSRICALTPVCWIVLYCLEVVSSFEPERTDDSLALLQRFPHDYWAQNRKKDPPIVLLYLSLDNTLSHNIRSLAHYYVDIARDSILLSLLKTFGFLKIKATKIYCSKWETYSWRTSGNSVCLLVFIGSFSLAEGYNPSIPL